MTDGQIESMLRRQARDDRALQSLLKGLVGVAMVLAVLSWIGIVLI